MKFLLVQLVVLAVIGAALADTSKWTEFRVKYSPVSTGVGVDSFWTIHKTLKAATLDGYHHVQVANTLPLVTLCYWNDVRVCPLYDVQGTIAGMMLSIPPSEVEGHGIPYDFNDHPVYEKKTIDSVVYWTSTYYLVDPKVIVAGGRPNDVALIGEGLWLKSGSGFTEVPTDLKSIQDNTPYTWQNCIPSMGIHYYYNMTQNTRCEDTQPYFLLVKDDNIVGLGWQFNGRTTPVRRDYYDAIDGNAVKATVPLAPTCLAEGADTYGVISIHMYFVEKPWKSPASSPPIALFPFLDCLE